MRAKVKREGKRKGKIGCWEREGIEVRKKEGKRGKERERIKRERLKKEGEKEKEEERER